MPAGAVQNCASHRERLLAVAVVIPVTGFTSSKSQYSSTVRASIFEVDLGGEGPAGRPRLGQGQSACSPESRGLGQGIRGEMPPKRKKAFACSAKHESTKSLAPGVPGRPAPEQALDSPRTGAPRACAATPQARRRRGGQPRPRAEQTLAERALEAGDVSAMQHTDAHQRGGSASGTAAAAAADGAASAATSSTAQIAIAGAFELAAPATVLTHTRPKAPQPASSGPFTTPAQAAATSTAWSSRVAQDMQQTHAAHRSTASGGVGAFQLSAKDAASKAAEPQAGAATAEDSGKPRLLGMSAGEFPGGVARLGAMAALIDIVRLQQHQAQLQQVQSRATAQQQAARPAPMWGPGGMPPGLSTPVHNGGTDGTLHAAGATVAEDATVPEHVASFGIPHAGVRAAPAALAANRRRQGPLEGQSVGLLAAVKKQKEVKKQERAAAAVEAARQREERERQKQLEKELKSRLLEEARARQREERQREKEQQQRQREAEKQQRLAERLVEIERQRQLRQVERRYPCADSELLIEDGEFKGQPHTVLPAPTGGPTSAQIVVGTELEEAALCILDFLSLFGGALLGVSLPPLRAREFLQALSSDGMTVEEQELFHRLLCAVLPGCAPPQTARGFACLVLTEAAEGRLELRNKMATGPDAGMFAIWSLLTPLTWPALLSAFVKLPRLAGLSVVDEGEGRAGGECVDEGRGEAALEPDWREELSVWLLGDKTAMATLPTRLKILALHLLCEEACASAGMHAVVDARLERKAAAETLDKKESSEWFRKRQLLLAELAEKRRKIGVHREGDEAVAMSSAGFATGGGTSEATIAADVDLSVKRTEGDRDNAGCAKGERDAESCDLVEEEECQVPLLSLGVHMRDFFPLSTCA